MCRTIDSLLPGPLSRDQSSLKIKVFFVRFKGFKSCKPFPADSLTLLYLPRSNESELITDASKVQSDSPAFLTLHRVVNAKMMEGEAIFGSRERVRIDGGVLFEIYLGKKKVLEGSFRKEEEWKLECECGLEGGIILDGGGAMAEADVFVAVEGHMGLGGRVEMVSKKKNNRRRTVFNRLEVILEEREETDDESDGGGDLEESCGPDCDVMMEMDLEGVRWAVDVGLWVVCLGVGYLVSKASARSLRRLRLL